MVSLEIVKAHSIEIPPIDRTPDTIAELTYLRLKQKEIKPHAFRSVADDLYWYVRDSWVAELGLKLAEEIDLVREDYEEIVLTDIEAISARYAESIELTGDTEDDKVVLGFCLAIICLDSIEPDETETAFPWTDEEIVNYIAKRRQLDLQIEQAPVLKPRIVSEKVAKRAEAKGQLSLF